MPTRRAAARRCDGLLAAARRCCGAAGRRLNKAPPQAAREAEGSALGHQRKIAVIGLGYVGLPVAVAFARSGVAVIGFDIDSDGSTELRAGVDRTREIETVGSGASDAGLYRASRSALAAADFYIVTVPTPIDAAHRPDLPRSLEPRDTVGRDAQARRHRGL